MSHVAYRENTRNVRFKKEWIAIERPLLRTLSALHQIRPGKDKPSVIPFNRIAKPVRSWQGSDEDEHGTGRHSLDFVRVRTKHRDLLQMRVAMHLRNSGMRPQLNIGSLFNLIN